MESKDTDTKLRAARQFFEDAVDHTRESHAEAHRAERFYHNTRLEGQWESGDLQYLREAGRPAFSFNLVKDKVDSFLGMYSDAQRTPRIAGTGAEDKLLAETIEIVKTQILQDAKYERKAAAQLKTGTVAGECAMHVEVLPSKKGRGWIEVRLHRILPFELHWDASCIEADRSDARHFFWDRWLSKAEFEVEYPDFADEFSTLSKTGDPYEDVAEGIWSETDAAMQSDSYDDYSNDKYSRYYFDRQKRKIRVIRYEYKTYVDKHYATDLESGQVREIDADAMKRIEQAREVFGDVPIQVETKKEEVVKVCEFVGSRILAEYDTAGPFDGFSVESFTYMVDEEEGIAYGMVRNLFDPQMEFNKSKNLEIEHIAQSTAPGTIAEEDSIPDEHQFMAQGRMPGGVRYVSKGALTTGQVKDDVPQPPSMAVIQRAANALEMVDRVSGIPSSGTVQPASQAEAATTVALRYHKSRQIVQDPISNFEHCQQEIIRRVAQAISRSMPDDQFEAILANQKKYVVGNGMVVEMVANPQAQDGEMVPRERAMLRDLRDMDWNIEMEHSSDNSTLRMLELDTFMKLLQAGTPVDPEVLMELATSSRSLRERLKAYAEKSQQAAAEGAKQQAETFSQQTQAMERIQMLEIAEKARHNQAEESIKVEKNRDDSMVDWATLWEKADEAEKRVLMQTIRDSQRPTTGAIL